MTDAGGAHEITIEPRSRLDLELGELVRFRELVYFFAWREFKVRYKQTVLGAAWAVLQPFVLMVVFTFFFNRFAGIESSAPNVPYAVFAYVGLLFWLYFSNTLTFASNSLVQNQQMLTKIYFPRVILPLSSVLVGLIDFAIAFIILIIIALATKTTLFLGGFIVLLPLLLIVVATTLGASLWFAAINVRFRDIKYALPFMVQTLMFLTPIIYPVALLPPQWRWTVYLNPIGGVVNEMRDALLGNKHVYWEEILVSVCVAALVMVSGWLFFKHQERNFADII